MIYIVVITDLIHVSLRKDPKLCNPLQALGQIDTTLINTLIHKCYSYYYIIAYKKK